MDPLKKPIFLISVALFVYCCKTDDFQLAWIIATTLTALFALVTVAKANRYIAYLKRVPVFAENNLTETYNQDGFLFLVAQNQEKIAGTIGLQRINGKTGK